MARDSRRVALVRRGIDAGRLGGLMAWYVVLVIVLGGIALAGFAVYSILRAVVTVLCRAWWEGR